MTFTHNLLYQTTSEHLSIETARLLSVDSFLRWAYGKHVFSVSCNPESVAAVHSCQETSDFLILTRLFEAPSQKLYTYFWP